jgi:hypothetical protein
MYEQRQRTALIAQAAAIHPALKSREFRQGIPAGAAWLFQQKML